MLPTFYGWRIVAFAALILMLTAPGQTIGISVFVDEMILDLNLSRSDVALAYLIGTVAGALTLPFVGRAIDHFGVQLIMTVTGIAFGLAILSMSAVSGMVSMTLGFAGVRMLGQSALQLTATTSVSYWFERQRGTAIGISNSVGTALMSLAPIVLALVIAELGWRTTWLVTGPIVGGLVVLIARAGMRDRPSDLGLVPDGGPLSPMGSSSDESEEVVCGDPSRFEDIDAPVPREGDAGEDPESVSNRGRHSPNEGQDWTRNEAIRTLMFWGLAFAMSSPSLIFTGLVFHQISVLGQQGLTTAQASAVFVPISLAALGATFLAGTLADRMPPKLLVVVTMLVLLIGMASVRFVGPGWSVTVYAVLVGSSSGAMRSLEATLIPRYFGLAHVGAIRGLAMFIHVAASAAGPYLLALGFERFGAYSEALIVLMVLPIAASILTAVAPTPTPSHLARLRAGRVSGGDDGIG